VGGGEDGEVGGWLDEWMDGWMNEWMDGWFSSILPLLISSPTTTFIFQIIISLSRPINCVELLPFRRG